MSCTAPWKRSAIDVDLGAVAGGEHHDLGHVLATARSWSALGRRPSGTAMRSSRSSGTVRWFSPTTTTDTPAGAPLPRPTDLRGSGPASPSRGHSASRAPRWTDPRPGWRRARVASSSRSVSYSGPSSASRRARSHDDSAGLRPLGRHRRPCSAPRRTTDGSVNEQLSGSSAPLTHTPARLAVGEHGAVDLGRVGGRDDEPVAGDLTRLGTAASSNVTGGASARDLVADRRARRRARGRRTASRPSHLAGGHRARRRRRGTAGPRRSGSPGTGARCGATQTATFRPSTSAAGRAGSGSADARAAGRRRGSAARSTRSTLRSETPVGTEITDGREVQDRA